MAREDTANEPEMFQTVASLFDSEESSFLYISDLDTCVLELGDKEFINWVLVGNDTTCQEIVKLLINVIKGLNKFSIDRMAEEDAVYWSTLIPEHLCYRHPFGRLSIHLAIYFVLFIVFLSLAFTAIHTGFALMPMLLACLVASASSLSVAVLLGPGRL